MRFGVVRHAPQAVSLDKQWTRGVPDRWPAVGDFLKLDNWLLIEGFPIPGRLT